MTIALADAPNPADRVTRATAWAGVAAGLWLLYLMVFLGAQQIRPSAAMADAAANVVPIVVLAAGVLGLVRQVVTRRPVLAQAAAHLVLAPIFVFGWYGGVVVMLAVSAALRGGGFHPTGFSGPGLAWQMYQGVVIYCATAAIGYALDRRTAGAEVTEAESAPLERYLIRAGEDFRPVDVADIVTITGAGDYSEVTTRAGHHLVRMSLAAFEGRLDPSRFIRVHRSTIIHLAQLDRAEVAGGGRMLAHMSDGEVVQVSRAGVKVLRSLIV